MGFVQLRDYKCCFDFNLFLSSFSFNNSHLLLQNRNKFSAHIRIVLNRILSIQALQFCNEIAFSMIHEIHSKSGNKNFAFFFLEFQE